MNILQKLRETKVFRGKDDLDLTEGPLKENLFYLAIPIAVINLLRTAYSLVDTYWLGRYSEEALAGISVAYPVQFLFISLGFGVAIAGSVLVAQYEGAGNGSKLRKAASQAMSYGLGVSLVIGVLMFFLVGTVVRLLGAEPSTIPAATGYLQVISLGMFTFFGFSVFISLMRGYGEAVVPMLIMLGTVIANVFLDPVFIFGWWIFPEMGATGAAVVTIILRTVALAVGLWMLFTGRYGLQISLAEMVPTREFGRKILRIGVPASLESAGRAFTVNLVVAVVGLFGATVMAGYGIGIRIFSMVFLPAVAVDRAVETAAGQNLGAGNFDRAQEVPEVAGLTGFALLSILGIYCFLYPYSIARLFTTNQEIVGIAAEFIRINSLSFGFLAIARSFSGAFRAGGRTIVPAVIAIGTIGLLRVPISYFLSRSMGPEGIWAAFPVSNVAGGMLALALFLTLEWKRRID